MIKKWWEKRREKKRQKEIDRITEIFNDTYGGDWYYDEDSDTYMDCMTTRTVTVHGDAE